ncbi:MAG: hypothetical protein JWP47_124 [Polaromonas sp.]|jgi:hypothetical protein|nr:hypothetical protein [Polaromonas sp.]
MKVLNLQCSRQHSFEGWFGSEDEFQSQLARALIECPLCADTQVRKMPTAPRLNLGAQDPRTPGSAAKPADVTAHAGADTASSGVGVPAQTEAHPQADVLKALRQLVARTEDVGNRFASEARRMHDGDIETRSIRGRASADEVRELLDDGIEVLPLAIPAALIETLQ